MSRSQLELKLIPVSKKLSKKGGYRGHIVGRREMGYDEVIEEAIKTSPAARIEIGRAHV